MVKKAVKKTTKKTVKKYIKKTPKKAVVPKRTQAKKPVKKFVKKPAKKPASKAVKKPAKKTVAKPVAKPAAKPKTEKTKNLGLKTVGLIINIIILPGLGTLIGGGKRRTTAGTWQLILAIVGWALTFFISVLGSAIGLPLIFIAWIWSIISMARSFSD